MKKRIIVFSLIFSLFFAFVPTFAVGAVRDTSFEQGLAEDLKELGLFRGVSETNFDLNREPTRIEAIVMLVRVLGKEEQALSGQWQHPFTDVPDWADKYIGYAYANGLTKGSSDTLFGDGNASSAMYLTFVLRALNYSDTNNADFRWDNPYSLATLTGILPDNVDVKNFLRADVVSISYAALPAYLKGTEVTLASKLWNANVFTEEKYLEVYRSDAFENAENSNPNNESNNNGNTPEDDGLETIHYSWECRHSVWDYDLVIPVKAVEIYRSWERDPYQYYSGYTSYVLEESDDEYLNSLAQVFINTAERNGWTKDVAVELAVTFVQSLKYTADDIGLGYDYPKYPLETLYDQGGDCEDSSILLVSLLREMGYGCALIAFDDHMGVGILGDENVVGTYYELNGNKYFYIETTSTGWDIGELPRNLHNELAHIFPF